MKYDLIKKELARSWIRGDSYRQEYALSVFFRLGIMIGDMFIEQGLLTDKITIDNVGIIKRRRDKIILVSREGECGIQSI